MVLRQIAFWLLAGLTAVSTLGVVVTRNVVHSALALAASLMGAAGLFILFGAEFVGLAQVLIYVGAVVILFLFGIMLTSASAGRPVVDNEQRGLAALVAFGVFIVLAIGIVGSYGRRQLNLDVAFSTTKLGTDLFTKWILPFEAVSVLLLAALVGAIVLARKD
jgi:NADH-quinone oxidoreductase subunit J